MSEQKTEQQQIEEMAYSLCDANKRITDSCKNCPLTKHNESCLKKEYSKKLYAADYRKQSDVAEDIISKAFERIFPTSEYDGIELIGILREVAAEIGAEVKE